MTSLRKYKMFELDNRDFFLWIIGCISVVGLVGWLSGASGKQVASFSHQISNITQDSSFSTPTFQVKKGEIYRMVVTSGKMSNNWMAIGLSLQDDDDAVVNELEAEFWHESGYDDGYWSESDYRDIIYFKATKTEKLSGEVYWAGGSLGKRVPQINTVNIKITTAGTKVAANYFKYLFWVFGALLLVLVGIIYGD
ncbi:hypothetical protein BKI52_30715 [marine bacterium AO1-C]|nr:hypothetical protein BKI52_30715 [marine bacterium AO1-C]